MKQTPRPARGLAAGFLAALVILAPAAAATPQGDGEGKAPAPPELRARVEALLEEEYPRLEALYRHLHAHPELSFREERTAARIALELRAAGLEVTEGVGGHGVVGVMRSGDGPAVLLRTDLDALPVKEETGLPYASAVRAADDRGVEVPVMHACGHDMHMTAVVGAARLLGKLRQRWRGTLVVIGQPAEERGAGARAMLADGLFSRFPRPKACVALHVHAGLAAGSVGWVEGPALANTDSVDITFRGVGGHGAWPHTTRDPVVLAAQAVLAFQTIVSRETEPDEAAVVTVGSIHGGTKRNVIPDEVKLELTVRSFDDKVRARALASLRRIAFGLAEAAGVPVDRRPVITIADEPVRALHNDPELTRRLRGVLAGWLPAERIVASKPVMGGEDFSEYGRTPDRIPICLLWLGSVDPERLAGGAEAAALLPSLHSSRYHPLPGPTIRTGATALTAAALHLLTAE